MSDTEQKHTPSPCYCEHGADVLCKRCGKPLKIRNFGIPFDKVPEEIISDLQAKVEEQAAEIRLWQHIAHAETMEHAAMKEREAKVKEMLQEVLNSEKHSALKGLALNILNKMEDEA